MTLRQRNICKIRFKKQTREKKLDYIINKQFAFRVNEVYKILTIDKLINVKTEHINRQLRKKESQTAYKDM